MILSLRQIATLNETDLGVNGRLYEDVEQYTYIGKGTRLFKFAKCSEVSFVPTLMIPETTVCDAINNVDGRLVEVTNDLNAFKISIFGDIWAANTLTKNC